MLRWQCFFSPPKRPIYVLCFQNVLWDILAWSVNTDASVRMVACVTDRVACVPVQQAGWARAVRRVKNVMLRSYHNVGWKKMSIRKMTCTLIPFCVFWSACTQGLYGPGCKENCRCDHNAPCHHITGTCTCPAGWRGSHCEKSNFPQCLSIAPCWQTHRDSFVLFQFVYPVHMGSDVLSDATVLAPLPVTMWPGSVAANLVSLVTAVSEVSDYL